jgi:hypothetical protein
MFQALILFCTVFSVFAGTVDSKPWKQMVKPVKGFSDHQILALATDGEHLLVGSFLNKKKQSGFEIYDLKTGQVLEKARRIHLNPQDSITHILVDSKTHHVWIGTNNNLASARCYDDKWMIMKCDRSLLDDDVSKHTAPKGMSSLETATYDQAGGVAGEFKGGVYLAQDPAHLEKVYAPKDKFQWPVSSALTPDLAFVGTKGDGLIVINRANHNVERHPDHDSLDFAAAVTVAKDQVFIGGLGLYHAPLKTFAVK